MSYKWPEKDPDETADFSVDWSRFLGSDSIASSVFFVDDENGTKTQVSTAQIVNGLTVYCKATVSGNVATARLVVEQITYDIMLHAVLIRLKVL